jgi:hypothetical protein
MKKASIVILTAGFLVSGVGNNAQSVPSQKTSEQKSPNSASQPQAGIDLEKKLSNVLVVLVAIICRSASNGLAVRKASASTQ